MLIISPPLAAFAVYDPVINAFDAAGISVLVILDYTTVPGEGWSFFSPIATFRSPTVPHRTGGPNYMSSTAEWDAYIPTFAAACGQVAAHYNTSVSAWEVRLCQGRSPTDAPLCCRLLRRYSPLFPHLSAQQTCYSRLQIWNEEDYATPSPSYEPTVPAAIYGQLLKAAYQAIKVSDNILVVSATHVSHGQLMITPPPCTHNC